MNWLKRIDPDRRKECAEIKRNLSLHANALFGYEEKPSQETLDKARDDMIAKAIKAGASDEEADIIVDSIIN